MKKNNNKGFTLMEMLIVVAIIAVLVAIAIPVFTNQLEKAREATDMANIRSAYAEVMACALTDTPSDANKVSKGNNQAGDTTWSKDVDICQATAGWINQADLNIAGVKNNDLPSVKKGDQVTVTFNETQNTVTIVKK